MADIRVEFYNPSKFHKYMIKVFCRVYFWTVLVEIKVNEITDYTRKRYSAIADQVGGGSRAFAKYPNVVRLHSKEGKPKHRK
jgi:hypothetical protein